jgi:hypothetical protein
MTTFLSHSHSVHELVKRFNEALWGADIPTFFDEQNLTYGEDFADRFKEEINTAQLVVIFMDQDYHNKVFSPNIVMNFCRLEYFAAIRMRKPVLLVILDEFMRDLKNWDHELYAEFHRKKFYDMSSLDVTNNPEEFDKTCDTISEILRTALNKPDPIQAFFHIVSRLDLCSLPGHGDRYKFYDRLTGEVKCPVCVQRENSGNPIEVIEVVAAEIRGNSDEDMRREAEGCVHSFDQILAKIDTKESEINNCKEMRINQIRQTFEEVKVLDSYFLFFFACKFCLVGTRITHA